jgi:flagellin-like protein
MKINNNKKADMGIGTLILFIAFILVASVAASVIIFSSVGIQSKALNTGKGTSQEVANSIYPMEIYALNATSDQKVDYFFETMKVTSGSESLKLADLLLTMSTNNVSQDYANYPSQYTGYNITLNTTCGNVNWSDNANISAAVNVTAATQRVLVGCQDTFPTITGNNVTYYGITGVVCTSGTTSITVSIPSTKFGVSYLVTNSRYQPGSVAPAEVIKVCFQAPRSIVESENIIIDMVPKKGAILRTKTPMPSLMRDDRVYVYP